MAELAGRRAALAASLVCLLAGGRAAAEPSADDKALATALFREARALMGQGQTSDACLKFEESHRLDPSGGTILNLALCHEQEGKLARSWSEFNEAIAFARRDRRGDREAEATQHANKLEPRLSRLTVVVPAVVRVDGLRVERDGREISPASWSVAMPVDGGEHVVRATAPAHRPFATTIALPAEGGAATVEIPALAPTPPPAAPPPAADAPTLLVTAVAPPPDRKPRRTAAWIAGGAGLAQLIVASYYGLETFNLKSDPTRQDDAFRAADRSTALYITGLLTTAVGVYLYMTSRPTSDAP